MAFRSSLVRPKRHISSFGDVVDRFLVSSASSSSSSSSLPSSSSSAFAAPVAAAPVATDTNDVRHPFKPYRNAATGRWAPALISQRRQAKLASLALQTGRLDALPSGPKVDRLRNRVEALELHRSFESMADQVRYAPTRAASKKEGEDLALSTARIEGYKGPYTGRKVAKMFKGQKVERLASVRRQNIRDKIEGMKQTVEEWQAAKAENKAKFRPSLPF